MDSQETIKVTPADVLRYIISKISYDIHRIKQVGVTPKQPDTWREYKSMKYAASRLLTQLLIIKNDLLESNGRAVVEDEALYYLFAHMPGRTVTTHDGLRKAMRRWFDSNRSAAKTLHSLVTRGRLRTNGSYDPICTVAVQDWVLDCQKRHAERQAAKEAEKTNAA